MEKLFEIQTENKIEQNQKVEKKKKEANSGTYSSPLMMTQQFRFCPNPFRVDMYKGCDFGCKYCFANSSTAKGHDGFDIAKIETIERLFQRAFDENEQNTNSLSVELLQHHVPLHCGGMSDPFQKREAKYKLTYKLIELTKKYNYPMILSTKTSDIPDEYFEILDPKIHAFQVSIMGWDDDYIKKYETNTPTAPERLAFVKKLRDKGFWCSIRIQPLVDLEQAKKLVTAAGSIPSYITIEHLKIPNDNAEVKQLFANEYNSTKFYKSPNNMRNIEMYPDIKIKNIETIKEIANANGVLIGAGDNDLHHLTQGRCCCGIDHIGENFNDYLKYNLTYFITGECEPSELYTPKCNCKECFFSTVQDRGKYFDFKEKVDEYVGKHYGLVLNSEHSDVLKKIFKTSKNKLF